MKPDELLSKVNDVLKQEGIAVDQDSNLSGVEKLDKLILPALENSKNIQSSLYSYQPTPGKGFARKVKNIILSKVRNITIAVLERTIMRQQKVNELTFQALRELAEENKQLREVVEGLK